MITAIKLLGLLHYRFKIVSKPCRDSFFYQQMAFGLICDPCDATRKQRQTMLRMSEQR